MSNFTLTRREFLQATGALIASTQGSFFIGEAAAQGAPAVPPAIVGPQPTTLDTWIRINADGTVIANSGKMDCGQGLDTAYKQIIAEELDIPVQAITVTMGDTRLAPNQGGGSGSTGVRLGGNALRNSAAEARRVLVETAAAQLGVPASELNVENGRVFVVAEPSKGVTYAQLIGGKPFNTQLKWNNQVGNLMNVQGAAKPKDVSQYKIVGKGYKRADIADKMIATEHFTAHIRPAHLLHARAVRPPVAGAMPVEVDAKSISAVKGAKHFVKGGFVAVVAETEWDAIRASRMLKVTWSDAPAVLGGGEAKTFDYIRESKPTFANGQSMFAGKKAWDEKPTQAALATSKRVIEADYECCFQSHARISASCGVADVKDGYANVWSDTQKPHYLRDGIAKFLNMDPAKVNVKWMHGAGSYGRSDADEAPYEAALLSQAFGRPVRVQWMRNEGMAWDPKAPAAVISMKAGLDEANNITGWQFKAKGFNGWDVRFTAESPEHTLVGMQTGYKKWNSFNFHVPEESYEFPAHVHWWETVPPYLQESSPMRTAHMRAPQEMQTCFGQECFIDEVALAAGIDQVEWRLKYVKDPREVAVLKSTAEKFGWQARTTPRERDTGDVLTGRGIALHSGYGSYTSVAVEVEVNKQTGRIWIKRLVCTFDCGLIVNPIGIRASLEGQTMQAISRALYEEVHFDEKTVTSVDWMSYRIANIADIPGQMDYITINRPDKAMGGAGEPAMPCFPAAIANAVADATGVRIRRYPLTPERVKAALA